MSCSRGEASPNAHTKLKLFADSGGYCQNPSCNTNLFYEVGAANFHIAEMAHIISAGDKGPRSNLELSKADKGDYANLILLCPTCHTKIDKAQEEFPDDLIKSWKELHSSKIDNLFGAVVYSARDEARRAVIPLLNENKFIFNRYGPTSEERFNPESEMPKKWIGKIHANILPNNRKVLKILEENYSLLLDIEIEVVEAFKQHVLDFELRHIAMEEIDAMRFPDGMQYIFE